MCTCTRVAFVCICGARQQAKLQVALREARMCVAWDEGGRWRLLSVISVDFGYDWSVCLGWLQG